MATQSSVTVAPTGDSKFLKFVGTLSMISGWFSASMILIAVLITCQMIFVRFVLNQSTIWQTELVIYLVIGATLLGLPYVQRLRGHVNVDLLPLVLPIGLRRILAFITQTAAIIIVAIVVFYGFEFWHEAWSRNWKSDTVWGVRLWIPYMALPIGFSLYLLQLIADLVGLILRIDTPFGLSEDK